MRTDESRLADIIATAELGNSLGHGFNLIDTLALDLRDYREAVKIMRDRLDKANEEITRLRDLSDSQSEALNMMEMGRL